jgi:hypothetical protein
MSVNNHALHVIVVVEDEANRKICIGFRRAIPKLRQMEISRPVGGWGKVVAEALKIAHDRRMTANGNGHLVLVLDLDRDSDRLERLKGEIPSELQSRTFILAHRDRPEVLRNLLSLTLDQIGERLAKDCKAENSDSLWEHDHLRHNWAELKRLYQVVRPFLFE